MRAPLAIGISLLLAGLLIPGAAAADTGSMKYIVSLGARVNHGVTGVIPQDRNGIAVTWCVLSNVDPALSEEHGCIGGGTIWPSLYDPDAPIPYLRMTLSVSDQVTGPNVYSAICNYNPGGGSVCDNGMLDGFADASATGCGVALTADATGLHEGSDAAVAFTHNLWVDPSNSEVCLGTSGVLSVVFSNP